MTYHSRNAAGAEARAEVRAGLAPTGPKTTRLLEESAGREAGAAEPRSSDHVPVTKLIGYVIDRHHVYARRQAALIQALLTEPTEAQEKSHPELARVRDLFKVLRQELLFHMDKEEVSVFPSVIRAEAAAFPDDPRPVADPGAVGDDVSMLQHEHDDLCGLLDQIRAATNDYTPSGDACESLRTLYRALRELEEDLLQHICFEDNVLFPRALRAERRGRA